MSVSIEQFSLHEKKLLKEFVDLPYQLYAGNPHWIPRLRCEYLGSRWLGVVGLFDERHPYHQEAKTAFFLARDNQRWVGSICASIHHRYNEFHQTQRGTFGFFESIDSPEVAHHLLDAAESWCRKEGATEFIGPFNFTTNHTCGLLIAGNDSPPIIDMPYNPKYYERLLETYPLRKAKDLLSMDIPLVDRARFERFARIAEHTRKKLKVRVRPANRRNLKEDVRKFVAIYNDIWQRNWSFVPISNEETDVIVKNLESVFEPSLFLFAEIANEVVAVAGAIPDVNWALRLSKRGGNSDWLRLVKLLWRKRKIQGSRMMLYGVKSAYRQKGLSTLLFADCFAAAAKLKHTYGDIGWILEDNQLMLREALSIGAKPYKTYRIYQR